MANIYSLIRKSDGLVVNVIKSEEAMSETSEILPLDFDTHNLSRGDYYNISTTSKISPPQLIKTNFTGNFDSGSVTAQLYFDNAITELTSEEISVDNEEIDISSITQTSTTHSIVLNSGSWYQTGSTVSILKVSKIIDSSGRESRGFGIGIDL